MLTDEVLPMPLPSSGVRGAIGRPTLLEIRAGLELASVRRHRLWHGAGVPPGEGQPVLLVGGFLAGSGTLRPLRSMLERAGYVVKDAAIGRNAGPSQAGVEAVTAGMDDLRARTGRRVALIGHSRGGQIARVATVRRPDDVALLVTLGSPHRQRFPPQLVVRLPLETLLVAYRLTGSYRRWRTGEEAFDLDRQAAFPAEVPFVSVWSRSDGIVDWRACLDPAAQDAQVDVSHVGLGASVASWTAIAAALAYCHGANP